ncbi:MAG TPA: type II CAAX endopeptidase family protein [Polyangiaceae bacterium]|nr:type II CAAX endopeptidase family protein [Polyangiaceae bacterium]
MHALFSAWSGGLGFGPAKPLTPEVTTSLLPVERIEPASYFSALLGYPPLKALLPIPILAALTPIVFWFFRRTWEEVNREATAERALAGPQMDYRPAACFVITAIVLTVQEYYGGRSFYDQVIRPALSAVNWGPEGAHRFAKYDELWGYLWWSSARVIGYVLFPLPLWKLLFPKDSLLDMGLRLRGLREHVWIYGLCLAVVVPAMFIVAREPDFGSYYPFYKLSSRSYADWFAWEAMYIVQFFALEVFFRGFMLSALRRTLGASAIFAMALPYCMIHYGKPYLEANGAIVAGVVLGSLSMRTRSIYAGFLVHVTVALSMDILALSHRNALPHVWFAP